MKYLLSWTIELDAKSPEAAAQLAREIQLDPNNIASFFKVFQLVYLKGGGTDLRPCGEIDALEGRR